MRRCASGAGQPPSPPALGLTDQPGPGGHAPSYLTPCSISPNITHAHTQMRQPLCIEEPSLHLMLDQVKGNPRDICDTGIGAAGSAISRQAQGGNLRPGAQTLSPPPCPRLTLSKGFGRCWNSAYAQCIKNYGIVQVSRLFFSKELGPSFGRLAMTEMPVSKSGITPSSSSAAAGSPCACGRGSPRMKPPRSGSCPPPRSV